MAEMSTRSRSYLDRPPAPPASAPRGAPRVLYLSANDPRIPLTGAAQRANAFTRFLSERFPTHLRYLEGAGHAPVKSAPPASAVFPGLASAEGHAFSASRYFLFSPAVLASAERVLRAGQADVLVCDYGVWASYGLVLARKHRVPFVYSSHNVEWRSCFDKARDDFRRIPLAAWYYGVERLGVRTADVLVSITDADAARFSSWRGDRPTIVIPQGIDEKVFHLPGRRPVNTPKRVLFCGNMGSPFNREAIDAVAREVVPAVISKRPDTVFEFIGANPPASSPHPAMRFPGFVDDYAALLRTCDAVIVPILRGHGFPTKIVEALACGRQTVATPVGARGLTFHVPNLHVKPLDAFAPTLLKILSSSGRASAAGAAKIHRHYGWNAILAPLESAIRGLAARAGRAA